MSWDSRKDSQLRQTLEGSSSGFVGRPIGVTGVLARLFRTTIHDLGISGGKWDSLMEVYLKTELKIVEKKRQEKALASGLIITEDPAELNRRDRTSIRGNLNKEFKRKIMTWKVFCKGMRFLQIKRFKIVILAEHYSGRITEHSTIVSFEDTLHEINMPDDPALGGFGSELVVDSRASKIMNNQESLKK